METQSIILSSAVAPAGTTGTAQLHADADRVKGVLQIKMGGKNMTFSQRIEAKRQGDCDSPP
jgi:hypothetical protein